MGVKKPIRPATSHPAGNKLQITPQHTDENVPPSIYQTPSKTRFRDCFSTYSPTTKQHRAQLTQTPQPARNCNTDSNSVYAIARQLFSQSKQSTRLIGRNLEREQLRAFVNQGLQSGSGGCTYVSGPPGTGKSALVEEVLGEYDETSAIKISRVNCVGLKTAKEIYPYLIQKLCPSNKCNWSDRAILQTAFTSTAKRKDSLYLIMLDEVDSLLETDVNVLHGLFGWALHKNSRLLLIGIANALDLTDRCLPQLKAQNLRPLLLPFLPYTSSEIASILIERLRSALPSDSKAAEDFTPFVHPAAIQLSSRKVASQTGDLRKAFALIRKAIDAVDKESQQKGLTVPTMPSKTPLLENANLTAPPTPPSSSPLKSPTTPRFKETATWTVETAPRVTVAHIARLASQVLSNGATSRLNRLNLQQKAVLCSLISFEVCKAQRDPFSTPSKSSSSSPTLKALYSTYSTLCRKDDGVLQPLTSTEFRDVVASLETLGLVHESFRRQASFLTPTKTPSRLGPVLDSDFKQVSSSVTEKEIRESLKGPAADLLLSLLKVSQ